MKKILIFLAGLLFLVATGCAATRPVVVIKEKPLPPEPKLELLVYGWNESDHEVEITLIKKATGEKKFFVLDAGVNMPVQPLKEYGEYAYYAFISVPGMVWEKYEEFEIRPHHKEEYKGRTAGYHIVIEIGEHGWKKKRERNYLSLGSASGEIRYGSNEDVVRGSIAGVEIPAEVRLGGGFAVLGRILTRR